MPMTIASFIITPDGTKLQSFHRNDYKTHKDAVTGEEYMIDGGTDYQRTNINKVPATAHVITTEDPHYIKRRYFHWGTYGKDGKQPLQWRALEDMSNEHIAAVLEINLNKHIRQLLLDEIEWRDKNNLTEQMAEKP